MPVVGVVAGRGGDGAHDRAKELHALGGRVAELLLLGGFIPELLAFDRAGESFIAAPAMRALESRSSAAEQAATGQGCLAKRAAHIVAEIDGRALGANNTTLDACIGRLAVGTSRQALRSWRATFSAF